MSSEVALTHALASPVNRLVAQGIDVAIGASPLLVGAILQREGPTPLSVALAQWGPVWWLAFHLCCDWFHGGQSPGKIWIDLRVVSIEDGVTPCSFWQSVGRNLFLMFLGPLDWLFIVGDRHQRLGDIVAGTVVIDVTPIS